MSKPWGCHNTERKPGYFASSGRDVVQLPRTADSYLLEKATWIVDVLTRECQYRKAVTNDPRCEGCTK